MVKIKDWLEGDKDYNEGLLLLMKVSRNRTLLSNLGKRKRPGKLENELRRISGINKPVEPTAPVKPEAPKDAAKKDDPSRVHVRGHKHEVDLDKLPKDLKQKWHQNQDAYKEIRSLHEKLKLMLKATDQDRAPLTMRISELDMLVRKNWEAIDAFVPGEEVEEVPLVPIEHKRINANRKYISVWLRKLEIEELNEKRKESIIKELQLRYEELAAAGETFEEKTIEALTALNIIEDGQTGDA